MIYQKHMFPGLDLYCTDPTQHVITAGEDLDDLHRHLSHVQNYLPNRVRWGAHYTFYVKPLLSYTWYSTGHLRSKNINTKRLRLRFTAK